MKTSFFDYSAQNAAGQEISLSQYKGKTVLVVNVASRCGYTKQYAGLEELYKKYSQDDFVILGFPCNQFGAQEPGSNEEIQSFCQMNFGVSFPVFSKIDVNGDNTAPVYQFLKSSIPGILGTEAIKWNFTKFLVGKDGKVIQRYGSNVEPKDLENDITSALGQKKSSDVAVASSNRIQTYKEFWPFYLREHSSRTSRNLHFIGTASALSLLIPILLFFPSYWPVIFVLGYAFAWVGHFKFEKNRPATFKYPLWSLFSDFKMLFHFLKGNLDDELQKAGVQLKD